jgi:hypothetical protein
VVICNVVNARKSIRHNVCNDSRRDVSSNALIAATARRRRPARTIYSPEYLRTTHPISGPFPATKVVSELLGRFFEELHEPEYHRLRRKTAQTRQSWPEGMVLFLDVVNKHPIFR